jgi:hypothetical protein
LKRRFWRDLWDREGEFLKGGRQELRHGASFVGVSKVAGQFYCEYKLENEFLFGQVPTESKEIGTGLHEELIPTVPIDGETFARLVSRRRPSYAVIGVWGRLADLPLIGMPDHIIWTTGRPIWLVELKTTRGDPTPLWDDQLSQTLIYGALLERMGFDCSELRLALVRIRTGEGLDDALKRRWITKVSDALQSGRVDELEYENRGAMKVHLIKHDVAAAEASVRRMQGYWLRQREPVPSSSVAKCRACEYSPVCAKTLYEVPSTGAGRV